jgi:predicted dehydrogenase
MHHLPTLKRHPGAALTAICGRNRDRAEAMAKKYAIPQVFTDYRSMLEDGNLHAVVVVTPDEHHYPITMQALAANLHVLCEKPLALTAEQARSMYEKAEAGGRKHMVLFTYRWLPHYRYVRQLIDAGYIGRCFHCQIRYVAGYGRAAQYRWRFDRQRSTGSLGDLGSHMIDLARWYVGDVAKVSAHLATFVERPSADGAILDPANDAALLAVEFTNGAHGTIQVSAVAHVGDREQEQHVVLHGESGTLEIVYNELGAEIRGARHDEAHLGILPVPDELWGDTDRSNLSALMFEDSISTRQFIDAIAEDRIVAPTFYDGWKAQEVIDAALVSHQNGCWVSLP